MKPIKGYEELYAITEDGQVYSIRRKVFLKHREHSRGYQKVILCKDGEKKDVFIHRLVAEAFIPNPSGLPQVNHKDEDKTNNNVSNLEWCDAKYNNNYGSHGTVLKKSVYCIELDKTFDSAKEAANELGLHHTSVCKCCRGELKTTGGYHFRYKED